MHFYFWQWENDKQITFCVNTQIVVSESVKHNSVGIDTREETWLLGDGSLKN